MAVSTHLSVVKDEERPEPDGKTISNEELLMMLVETPQPRLVRDTLAARDIYVTMNRLYQLKKNHGVELVQHEIGWLKPWTVARRHQRDRALQMLRLTAKSFRGEVMTRTDQLMVENWLAGLHEQNEVIDYDREAGFRRVPRRFAKIRGELVPIDLIVRNPAILLDGEEQVE